MKIVGPWLNGRWKGNISVTVLKKGFAFTVSALGHDWDVYYFEKNGNRGTVAFRKTSADGEPDSWEIGVFCSGELARDRVLEILEPPPPPDPEPSA